MRWFTRDDTTPSARAMWAKSISQLLEDLARPEPPFQLAGPLYRRDVATACAHSLDEIRGVLADDAATVRSEAMRRLRAFMTDGATSPFYGVQPEHARRAGREIAAAFRVPAFASAALPSPVAKRERPRAAGSRA
jgi:hypothetical protein